MKHAFKIIAVAAAAAGMYTTALSQVDNQAWATEGGYFGGGNSSPQGAANYNSAIGHGGFNFHNGPIIANWDDFNDYGTLIFNATFANGQFDNTAALSTNYVYNWGLEPANTATYGQSFIAPDLGNLQSFSFFLQGGNDGSYDVQAFVISWSGSLIGGQPHDESGSTLLYASNPFLYTPNGAGLGSGTWQEVTANIGGGGLDLTAGQQLSLIHI